MSLPWGTSPTLQLDTIWLRFVIEQEMKDAPSLYLLLSLVSTMGVAPEAKKTTKGHMKMMESKPHIYNSELEDC